MIAVWCDALLEVRLGNAERVEALAAQMEALVEKFALGLQRLACGWLRGWALARTGRPGEGFRLIRDAYEENVRLVMLSGGSEVLQTAPRRCCSRATSTRPKPSSPKLSASTGSGSTSRSFSFMIEASIARARASHPKPRWPCTVLSRKRANRRRRGWSSGPCWSCALPEELRAAIAQALAALVERMPEAKDTEDVAKARAILAKG